MKFKTPDYNTLQPYSFKMKKTLLTSALLLSAGMSFGAGYQLNLQGLRQLAMGGGGVAMPWDAATLFYNPGGLSYMKGIQAYGSVLAIVPRISFLEDGTNRVQQTEHQTFTPFNAYVGGVVKEGSRFGMGIGINTPYGSGTKWEDDWSGRYVSQEIELRVFFAQPTVSYRISENLSIGAGFIYAFGDVSLSRAIPLQNQNGADGQAVLDGNAHGYGYNIGLSIKANDRLHFGLSYRSKVDMDVEEGNANFKVPASVASNFPNTTFEARLPLPSVLSVGAAYKPYEKLTVQLDFNLTGWKAYDTLGFDYAKNTPALQDTRAARRYQDRLAVRLGGSYQASERLQFMLGGAYDPTPVRNGFVSPDLPDADRFVGTGGISFRATDKLTLLAVVEYLSSEKRKSSYDEAGLRGTYQTKAITPGIGITYDF